MSARGLTLTQAMDKLNDNCWWGYAEERWAQRWARAHGVRKAGRDYRFGPHQVEQMAADYRKRR